ncbi:hypothetical protein [Candidatus Poriferisodalis sp.]|uniref:hypothetical protein n=1 Tax=Candidatus Poriferisodalis sp. TaxID=3101277 RepID=UPI003C705EB2
MTATDTETAPKPSLWAKLFRRQTRAEYAIGLICGLAVLALTRTVGFPVGLVYGSALFVFWPVWMLARPMPPADRLIGRRKRSTLATEDNSERCRWCGLRPRAVLCGGRSGGGPCESTAASDGA